MRVGLLIVFGILTTVVTRHLYHLYEMQQRRIRKLKRINTIKKSIELHTALTQAKQPVILVKDIEILSESNEVSTDSIILKEWLKS